MKEKLWVVVDVEADGPCPGRYSMVSFGAVAVEPGLKRKFLGETAPISHHYDEAALKISGVSRSEHRMYASPSITMSEFDDWLNALGAEKLVFVSDNPAFDWQFINFYFQTYVNRNLFGHSAKRIGDLWDGFRAGKGNEALLPEDWRSFGVTPHTHNPIDDATRMAECLLAMKARGLDTIPA